MFITAFCGNKSIEYGVPFPLYLTIKSSNLVASLIVGYCFFEKKYRLGQVISVVFITIGAVTCTVVSRNSKSMQPDSEIRNDSKHIETLVGILMCTGSTMVLFHFSHLNEMLIGVYNTCRLENIIFQNIYCSPCELNIV